MVLSAYSSYSGMPPVSRGSSSRPERPSASQAPTIDKMRVFYNHPDFVAVNADRVTEALDAKIPDDRRAEARRQRSRRIQHPGLDGHQLQL